MIWTLCLPAAIEAVRRHLPQPLYVLAGIFMSAGVATGTTLPHKNLAQLVAESDAILIATVDRVKSFYTDQRDIYTLVTLTDLTLIHGRYAAESITLKVGGGEIDGDVLEVHGAPRFQPEDRVLLFVRDNGTALVPLVGWTQGFFRLVRDPASRREVVNDHSGNRVLGVQGDTVVRDQRFSGDALILHRDSFSPGTTDDGSATGLVRPRQTSVEGTALSVADFRKAIVQKLKSQRARARTLTSVSEPLTTDSPE